jgi:branched-chain amino acid transport system substrate-binding protein
MRCRITRMFMPAIAIMLLAAAPLGAQPPTLKVGLLTPITGLTPDWGKKQVVAMKMAVDEVNKRGGVAGALLEAVIRDTAGDPKPALDSYRKLAGEDRVLAVIGPIYSDVFEALAPVTNDLKLVIIATAGAKPGLCDLAKRPYAFRMSLTSDKKEAPPAKAWVSAHGIKKVVILYDQESPTWETLATKLWPVIMKDLNVQILNLNDPLSFRPGERDFSALVNKVTAYRPDGICIAGFPDAAGYLVKELRQQGLKQPILGGSGVVSPKVVEIAGEAAEDLWSNSLFCLEDLNPKLQDYVRQFRQRCREAYPSVNCDAEQYDETAYDVLLFLADIMRKKGITGNPERLQEERDKIREGLAAMGSWRGTAGMMAFDKMGDGIRTVHLVKVKGGKWQHAE